MPSRVDGRLPLIALSCLFLCVAFPWAVRADEPQAERPAIRVIVDPRVELVSIIFRLAGHPEYSQGKVDSYTEAVEQRFGKFRDHAVVKLARELRRKRGVSYDACMSMAVHVVDAFDLKEGLPFDPYPADLDSRWGLDGAREFLDAARDFVRETSFREFIDEHDGLYRLTESRMRAVLNEHAHLEWFDDFFGSRPQATFTVTLGLLNGGNCYGARCGTVDGEDLYCILGVWSIDSDGQPKFDRSMLSTVVHEFCHSYANPIVDGCEKELRAAGEKIFPHVADAMRGQAYGNWKTMMYESLVRACEVRYTRRYDGLLVGWMAAQGHKRRKFLWISELSSLLGQYESSREQYPTLEAFAPRIVEFFDDYATRFDAPEEPPQDR